MPRHASRKPRIPEAPHCPGEIQAAPVAKTVTTMPKFVGLKTCLPRIRSANLLPMASAAARAATASDGVRRRRQSDKPEMRALRGS